MREPNNGKVLIAMSGGVDSSVAAYLMKQSGCEVTGVTMRLFDDKMISACSDMNCCSLSAIDDARSVADKLGIDYLVYDFRAEFEQEVITRFVQAYESGRTPNPCIECNRYLKFEQLYKCGSEIGMSRIATGHYAVIEQDKGSGRFMLKKATDLSKDQTYVLYTLSQEQLARTVLPLGSLTKSQVRELAEEQDFITAGKRESQDICFIPDGDYAGFIERYTGKKYPPGNFITRQGEVLGEHRGIINYTIGQRKGLGLALKEPAYVLELDMQSNAVILGANEDLFTRECEVSDFNWIALDEPASDIRAKVRIRYKHKEAPATVIPLGKGHVKVIFDEPQRAITKGQSAVVYDDDYVIGGGIII